MPEFDVNGKTVAGYFALSVVGHVPGVFVLLDWWGLTPFFYDVCERFCADGCVAIGYE